MTAVITGSWVPELPTPRVPVSTTCPTVGVAVTVGPVIGAGGSMLNVISVTMPSDMSTVALEAVLAARLG